MDFFGCFAMAGATTWPQKPNQLLGKFNFSPFCRKFDCSECAQAEQQQQYDARAPTTTTLGH